MNPAKGKSANTCLAQLRQALRYKAAIPFIRIGGIKQVACLNEKINTLAHSKISRHLEGVAHPLSTLFAFTRMLTQSSIAEMVIGRKHNGDNTFHFLLLCQLGS